MATLINANQYTSSHVQQRKVQVIYTGGTIGMMRNEDNVLVPRRNAFAPGIRQNPAMHDASWPTTPEKTSLMLPYVEDQLCRVSYDILEYDPLLDSSNMGIADWVRIAEDVQRYYNSSDGFVILHGTDTLSYTESALSFMLENLGKMVIVTGSQIPIFDARSDGRENFISALILAGNYTIPEVCVCFDRKLFRGNRTIKVNCDTFGAFGSPNATPLATMGVKVKVNPLSIRMPRMGLRLTVRSKMDPKVGLLRLYPTITAAVVRALLENLNGLVLMTYGAGNIPSNQADFIAALWEASERGVLMINVTQCTGGTVAALYETSQPLQECGVVPGLDMTPEAALAKLSYVLGREDWDSGTRKMADFIAALWEASERGVLMINVTQCTGGTVAALYETSQPLQECGVVPGLDMTPEAALAKLSYVLGREDWDSGTRKMMLRQNLRGEFTDPDGGEEEEMLLAN